MTHSDDELLMTPGPTAVPPAVLDAMGRPPVNPDVQAEFGPFYRDLLDKLARVYDTDDDVLVLSGEGILGLETAVASLVEEGDEVLCLANGIYGEGFADFVETRGGDPVVHDAPFDSGFDVERVKGIVENRDFAAATMVHCETPTGVLNDFEEVLGVLQDAGVLTIVDAVSSLGGTSVPTDDIDVCLGASQKCFSSPAGLTTVSVSDAAWEKVEATDQDTFYTSLAPWRDVEIPADDAPHLPYTHAVSNLYALDASLDRLLDEGLGAVYDRHEEVAAQCRERGRDLGLEPFATDDALASPTVTAFRVEGRAGDLQTRLEADHGVVLATGLGDLADDVLRVGHMGYNADPERVERTMDALADVLD
ncbi:alanine--glyoxylate aminotransferase family protein [Halorussus gelatinilyticus]|uniref:Alanine--glyoxylate aminotransferase family protein n=1 Tax=Halorussus gelatinilyticus TaxID=2937524 RepID=A0A8U0IET8_9EURY|nr:alanine--glyoxylate aminotransferase family protein [Halorussus gelatinilyticus]UPV99482.1 alanine--glyoxylate aminotransferase family protein [Halorussus gelatinilyticus]